jgi:hypothetical protein
VDDADRVDDEERALAYSVTVPIDAVSPRHFAFWFEVGQQGKMQFPLLREGGVTPRAID